MTSEHTIGIDDAVASLTKMWGPMTAAQTEALHANIEIRRYAKGDLIYRDNEVPTHMMCILSGKAKIYKDGIVSGCRRQILRIVRPMELFAFRAGFANERYKTSSIAFEPAVIACIPISLAEKLAMDNPSIAMYVIRHLAKILGRSDERIVNLTQKHIRGRLAETLLILMEEYGTDDGDSKTCLCMSREDLACFSNMTTSNAIRTLSAFASEGLLSIKGRSIRILDECALSHISQMG